MRKHFKKVRWGLAFMLAPILLSACQEGQIPKEIISTWVTDHQRYQGCYMLISQDEVTLGVSDATMHSYFIQKVKTKQSDRQMEVTIELIDDQQIESALYLVYLSNKNKGSLYFKNQPDVIWQRSPFFSPFY